MTFLPWFQYGFAKVRRGPDTDMYAHPSFVRGQPETLSHLRKISSATRRQISKGPVQVQATFPSTGLRSVSPSPTRDLGAKFFQPIIQRPPSQIAPAVSYPIPSRFLAPPCREKEALAPTAGIKPTVLTIPTSPPASPQGSGRLDLLTLALEREGCFAA